MISQPQEIETMIFLCSIIILKFNHQILNLICLFAPKLQTDFLTCVLLLSIVFYISL